MRSEEREVSVDLGHGLANNTNAVTWASGGKQETLQATHCANEMFASYAQGHLKDLQKQAKPWDRFALIGLQFRNRRSMFDSLSCLRFVMANMH